MQMKGIYSSSLTNRSTCGGDKKCGLVPRNGFILGSVNRNTVLARESSDFNGMMPKVCGGSYVSKTLVKSSYPYTGM